MNAGELRHLVTFQTPNGEATADGDGGFTQAWTSLTPDQWVAIRAKTGSDERRMAGTVLAVASLIVQTRFRDDIDDTCRMLFSRSGPVPVDGNGNPTGEARIFNVNGVSDPDERNIELLIGVTEVLS